MLPKVLLIEDSESCLKLAYESLKRISEVEAAGDFESAKRLIDENTYSLMIIDLNLPGKNGLEIANYVRNSEHNSKVPIFISSGDSEISKKVTAFAIGVDDYIVKPYSPLELKARVERCLAKNTNEQLYSDGHSGIQLNSFTYRAFIKSKSGTAEDLLLTPSEFKILNFLIRHKDRIFSRNQIIDLIWGKDSFINDRTVDVHISSLRKKLRQHTLAIASIRGEGYCWSSKPA